MKLRSFILLLGLCFAPAGVSQAETDSSRASDVRPLIELYTSQACLLCPGANQQFAEFAQENDVVALTFPVGYWDYLGWKDTFAQPNFSDRQMAFNEAMGRRGPYTPQVIFQGVDHCSATKKRSMSRKARRATADVKASQIGMRYDGQMVHLDTTVDDAELWLVEFAPGMTETTPEGGVNRGKPMVYYNRALNLTRMDVSQSREIEAPCPSSCVAILQREGHGDVLSNAVFQPNSDTDTQPISG